MKHDSTSLFTRVNRSYRLEDLLDTSCQVGDSILQFASAEQQLQPYELYRMESNHRKSTLASGQFKTYFDYIR